MTYPTCNIIIYEKKREKESGNKAERKKGEIKERETERVKGREIRGGIKM